MAITFVGAADYSATSGALPAFVVGDLALVFAYRDGSNTAPSLPAGWTNVVSSGANSNSMRVGYRVLVGADTTTSTWTNASEITVVVLRGQLTSAAPVGGNAVTGGVGNQLSYAAVTFSASGFPQGSSWVVGVAGHRTANNVNVKAVTGMTTRSGDVTSMGSHTAENVASFSASNYTTTVDLTAGWRSYAVEVRAASGATSTSVAEIHLEAGDVPAVDTDHAIHVRARVSAANGETLRAQVYQGSTARTSVLESSALTTSLTEYVLNITSGEAATITSYTDLRIKVWGYSSSGLTPTFTVSELSLSTPAGTAGDHSGAVIMPVTFGAVTSGNISGAGAKSTATARLSLASGTTPSTRTDHRIVIRGRRTALQGTFRAQLYEGSNPRSAVLETGELTTSLATYSLDVADADAAAITSYSNLEVRFWGYSSTGTSTVFEVAEVYLSTDSSLTGGDVEGAAVLTSSVTVTVGAIGVIYPAESVYPYPLITLGSTITAVVSASEHLAKGQVVSPFIFGAYSSGTTPLGNRQGAAVLNSVVTLTAVGDITNRYGAVLLDSVVAITVDSQGSAVSDSALLASTVTITVAGNVPSPPTPPGYVELFPDLPELQIAIAFSSEPLEPLQNYEEVTPYTRTINSKRGRQFELDRMEAGQSGVLFSNHDGRFMPENTSSPYYPNLKPSRRLRWRMSWLGTEYAVYHGFLEGYPQSYPSKGTDAVVQQRAVDATMALSLSKFVPGSTVLASALAAILPEATAAEETIDVQSTALPMPQAVPFTIKIEDEEITVSALVSGTQYTVIRAVGSPAHSSGVAVTTTAVSFGEEYSGQRIQRILERIGVAPADFNLDAGQSLLAPSEDIAGQAPVEHLTFVAEVEQGRFFVSKEGKYTFHDRHHIFKSELAARATFSDTGTGLPYTDIEVTHEHERIFNIVRITSADGTVAETRDEQSILDHFERVFEKQWPLADSNEAQAAAEYILSRYKDMQVRVPAMVVEGRSSESLWPHILGMEIGQRFRVIRTLSGTDLDKQLVVEGIEHQLSLSNMATRLQLSLADTTTYWQLEVVGYGELGTTTVLAY